MKLLLSTRYVTIPDNVQLNVQAREISVTGPKGSLKRSFKHMNVDLQLINKNKLRADIWFGNKQQLAALRTVTAHIENMITGVTRGFRYKLRFVYAHFPISVSLNKRVVEVRNFLGEQRVRRVKLLPGVSYTRTENVKDQIELTGIDINAVSLTAARIQQSTTVKNKDIRKFLDGIYVSERGPIPAEEN